MAIADLTSARVRELFDYNPLSGALTWRVRLAQCIQVGDVAGCRHTDGYIIVSIGKKRQLAHRLAWMHTYGHWPSMCIDHINGIKSDNRLCNLRDVSIAANNQNVKAARKDSASGIQGVRAVGNVFEARLKIGNQRKCLGFFASAPEASAAYLQAKRAHHKGFSG